MKTYFYISNSFSYNKCLNEGRHYIYISGYKIFNNVRKLDFCFDLNNNFFELLKYKKINEIIDNFINNTNNYDSYIFTANGYDAFSFILRDRLVQNGRRVVVEELDPERNIIDKNGFVSMLRYFPVLNLLVLVYYVKILVKYYNVLYVLFIIHYGCYK
jgi:hypothetical protein